ncbi:1-(5-phosphoribosyl)-5-[(5-phosphoribosylamino)methylideneamino]imidazole-4-carboxamide isomerase [Sporosarcina contaminans]|uniref:1-(5-phosphoribosyl)-5-[(5-phosphoribosylamino)methylideneamino] imidazole-4-carboxamide isomerase n=1 Tax=Sporosarcina contaminans TaxID=633403 RepID=A0ABW3U0V6_9BACL
MILFPAIDVRGGKCVRLIQGDYDRETIYHDAPEKMALEWQEQGAEWIHVVDLDGAKTGEFINRKAIEQILQKVNIPVQVGGGIRTMERVDALIRLGVSRVIIGTAAIKNPQFVEDAVRKYGDRIAVSIDARNGYVATDGWRNVSEVKAVDLLMKLAAAGVQTVVYTDIAKDGMLSGPNFNELQIMNEEANVNLIASGGVSSEQDIVKLKEMELYGAIIGKALYEQQIALRSVLEVGMK